jgi:hypothetical protein
MATVLLASLAAVAAPAAAAPPDRFGPFTIGQDPLDPVAGAIEQECADVSSINATGTIRFTHSYAADDADL